MKNLSFLFYGLIIPIFFILPACAQDDDKDDDSNPPEVPCISKSADALVISMKEGNFEAPKASEPIEIDGCSKEPTWAIQDWYDMNYKWMGADVDSSDYHGRFKLAWDDQYLYILVEVIDDSLSPTLNNGLANYWKGDYVEVFIDENQSGGNHQYNHQAFAYHVSTEGHAIDQSTEQEPVFFDEHVDVMRTREGDYYLWELAIKIYDDQFDENSTSNNSVSLFARKTIGFSMAYGDNDGNNSRENFMGSKESHGLNNDEGYINSDVFGSITFVKD